MINNNLLKNKSLQLKRIALILVCCHPAIACNHKNAIPDVTGHHEVSIYVSAAGKNTNPGTLSAPLQTIGSALDRARPGDTIFVRGGSYYEKVIITRSGNKDAYITLRAYPGEHPVINGGGLSVANGDDGLVTLDNVSWIKVAGFDVCNFVSSASGKAPAGIMVEGSGRNIVINHNKVYNIASDITPQQGRSAHAILIIGNTTSPLTNISVAGNEIHDCKTGYSENLTINGYVDTFTIKNNKIYNGENIGIDAAGGYAANPDPSFNYARNGVISDNELYNINAMNGPIRPSGDEHGAIGIYVDGARNIVVERNKIFDSDRGIALANENKDFPTSGCIVRNNFIYNCWLAGIDMGGYVAYNGGSTRDCYVVNNTLYGNNRTFGHSGEVEGEIRLTENCIDNVIKNNILYARPDRGVFIHKYSESGKGNVIDHNLYYSTGAGKWIWNGNEYTDFNLWKAACGGDDASVSGTDPQFRSNSAPDLHIMATSPAGNKGIILPSGISGETDIDGQPRTRNGQIDIGADELQ